PVDCRVPSIVLESPQKVTMETLSNLFTGTRLIDGGISMSLPPGADLATERHVMKAHSDRQAEWTVLRTAPVNALLIGTLPLTAAAVGRLEHSVRQPLVWWSGDRDGELPDLKAGTLVVRDVDHLDGRRQQSLADWIGTHSPCARVVALARKQLYPQVEAGRFSADLYYHLNTVVIEMRVSADLP
ncbi:MAG: hypothetical protein ACRD2I_19115, partial [Vicinamibacterales bacterium]